MGLSSGPRVFTKLIKTLFAVLRDEKDCDCIFYIDDSLFVATSAERCSQNTCAAIELFNSASFTIQKSPLKPAHRISNFLDLFWIV